MNSGALMAKTAAGKDKAPKANPFVARKETKDGIIHFRVAASQKDAWLRAMKGLGVKDQSAFFRGAIEAAIAMSHRAHDPQWLEFIQAIQREARSHLGVGIKQEGAAGFELAGKGVDSVPIQDLKKKLEKRMKQP
jgi:hypothetical protein